MRIPQQKTMRSMRATQPSTPAATARTTGPQGSPGGARKPSVSTGTVSGGVEVYLWALVLIEVFLMGFLRHAFRAHHGG